MKKTERYELNLIEDSDTVSPEPLNENARRLEREVAAAQTAGDRGHGNLKKLAGDLCRLLYHAEHLGAYADWRQGVDFDSLNSAEKISATGGALVPEPDSGRCRLAVDGWTGGSVTMANTSYVTIAALGSAEVYSKEWSPDGLGKVNTLAVDYTLSGAVSAITTQFTAELLQGDTVVATSDTASGNTKTSASVTLTFSSAPTVEPQYTYRMKITMTSRLSNGTQKVRLDTVTLASTAVSSDCGTITTTKLGVNGAELSVWAQYSVPGSLSAQAEADGVWHDMTPTGETDSRTPEGAACTEGRFALTLDEAAENIRLKFTLTGTEERYLYGWGAAVL